MKKIKYLIGLICLICLIWPISARPALAAGPATNSLENFQKAVKVGNNAQEFVGVSTLSNIMNGITSFIVGDTSCTPEMKQQKKCDTGALGAVGGMIAFMYEAPPISSKEYIADLGSNLGLTPKSAYAVGDGWKVLAPVMDLWKLMRNLTYLMFTIIFVVIGFMIMFRAKMGPAAVTIQMAIPKIVMSLILVTFSYAIAGLIVDVAFLGNGLINNTVFNPTNSDVGKILSQQDKKDPGSCEKNRKIVMDLKDKPNKTDAEKKLLENAEKILSSGCPITSVGITDLAGKFVGASIFKQFSEGNVFDKLGKILDPATLILFSFSMMIFSTGLSIFLGLLSKYITIILTIVFLPFQILFATVSSGDNAFSWVKSYISAVLAFPATYFVMNLSNFFLTAHTVAKDIGLKVEPLTEITPSPLKYFGGSPEAMYSLIALGIFLIIPRVPDVIDGILGVKSSPLSATASQQGAGIMKKIPIVGSLF